MLNRLFVSRRILPVGIIVSGLIAPNAVAAPDHTAPASRPAIPSSQPAARARWTDDDTTVKLQVAVRTLVPPGGHGPNIILVGAVHVGEQSFYEKIQQILDTSDLVLYEGVRPAGAGEHPDPKDSAACIKYTSTHLRMAGALVERFKSEHGHYPASADELATGTRWPGPDVVRSLLRDGWGRTISYVTLDKSGFDLISLGADGATGGTDADADLKWSQQPHAPKKSAGPSLYKRMADLLGVKLQTEMIRYDRPNFRNSDMSIDELQKRIGNDGISMDDLMGLLSGESLLGKFVGVVFDLINLSDELKATMRVMMTRMLGEAMTQNAIMLPGGESMKRAILDDRNAAVVADLLRTIREKPGLHTIAVFYGAAHLPGIQSELIDQHGYTIVKQRWLTAMRADVTQTSMTRKDIDRMAQRMAMVARQRSAFSPFAPSSAPASHPSRRGHIRHH